MVANAKPEKKPVGKDFKVGSADIEVSLLLDKPEMNVGGVMPLASFPPTVEDDGRQPHGRDVMPKRTKKHKPSAPAQFKIGDHVRVRHGIRDEDHPDMPLGGWTGTISEVGKHGIYSVRWSQETLASVHPIYKKRCAIDGTVLEEYWLGEEDLEPDPGGPLTIEQPTAITPRPLSEDEQGDRVRMVFGLTRDDLLPDADEDSLETYYDHLVERMSLPVEAGYCPQENFFNPSPVRRVKVVALDREVGWDEDEGILCKIRTAKGEKVVPLTDLEFRRLDPNCQLVEDFVAWFVGNLSEDLDDGDEWDDDEDMEEDVDDSHVLEEATWRDVVLLFLEIVAFAASYGAVVGAAVAAMPWARWAAYIGGGVLGLFVAVAQVASAEKDMPIIAPRFRKGLSGFVGLVTGAAQGAFFGIMAVAFIGAVLGGIVGLLFRLLVGGTNERFSQVFPGSVLVAAACGVTAQAFYLNRVAASEGFRLGAGIGLGISVLFCLVSLPLAFLTIRKS